MLASLIFKINIGRYDRVAFTEDLPSYCRQTGHSCENFGEFLGDPFPVLSSLGSCPLFRMRVRSCDGTRLKRGTEKVFIELGLGHVKVRGKDGKRFLKRTLLR